MRGIKVEREVYSIQTVVNTNGRRLSVSDDVYPSSQVTELIHTLVVLLPPPLWSNHVTHFSQDIGPSYFA